MLYRVTWEIELDADTAKEAAEKALAVHRNPESIATVFKVAPKNGESTQIDLTQLSEGKSIALSPLETFIQTIEATGGISENEDGTFSPLADPDWIDLADAYLLACDQLKRPPKIEKE